MLKQFFAYMTDSYNVIRIQLVSENKAAKRKTGIFIDNMYLKKVYIPQNWSVSGGSELNLSPVGAPACD